MIKLSISVMAHPSRKEYFDYLRENLGDIPFLIDEESMGTAWNCERAWKVYDPSANYHIVIQDDAIICKDFKNKAVKLIEEVTKERSKIAFNFYYGTRARFRDEASEAMKRGYIIKERPHWGLAICIPTSEIENMLKFWNTVSNPEDDERISQFLKSRNIPVYFPIPSYIDHRHELKSLVGDPGTMRKAYKFIDNK